MNFMIKIWEAEFLGFVYVTFSAAYGHVCDRPYYEIYNEIYNETCQLFSPKGYLGRLFFKLEILSRLKVKVM